jgi:hypothetical protein
MDVGVSLNVIHRFPEFAPSFAIPWTGTGFALAPPPAEGNRGVPHTIS